MAFMRGSLAMHAFTLLTYSSHSATPTEPVAPLERPLHAVAMASAITAQQVDAARRTVWSGLGEFMGKRHVSEPPSARKRAVRATTTPKRVTRVSARNEAR
jgi:hypothetical protein